MNSNSLKEETLIPQIEDLTISISQGSQEPRQDLFMMFQDLHTVVLPQEIPICQWMIQSSIHQLTDHTIKDPQEISDKDLTYPSNLYIQHQQLHQPHPHQLQQNQQQQHQQQLPRPDLP